MNTKQVYQCPRCATSMEVDPTAKPFDELSVSGESALLAPEVQAAAGGSPTPDNYNSAMYLLAKLRDEKNYPLGGYSCDIQEEWDAMLNSYYGDVRPLFGDQPERLIPSLDMEPRYEVWDNYSSRWATCGKWEYDLTRDNDRRTLYNGKQVTRLLEKVQALQELTQQLNLEVDEYMCDNISLAEQRDNYARQAGCLDFMLDSVEEERENLLAALNWYKDEAIAISNNLQAKRDSAVMATVTVLALDAGKRADAAMKGMK